VAKLNITMSKLKEIRQRLAALHQQQPICRNKNKVALRTWLAESAPTLQYGITLTLKQHLQVAGKFSRLNPNQYKFYSKLDQLAAQNVVERFLRRLNSELLGSAFRRFDRSLFYLPILDGCGKGQRLHLHIGVGAVPDHLKGPKFFKAVGVAARSTDWIDRQIDVVVADRDLATYNTKTVSKYDTEAVLWNLVPPASAYTRPLANCISAT